MKKPIIVVLFAVVLAIAAGDAQAQRRNRMTPNQLAAAVSAAFVAKDMGRLVAGRAYVGSVRIVIENSLSDRKTVKVVRNMKQAQRLIAKRENLDVGPVKSCRNGICKYNVEAGLHNHLYLKSITYGMRNRSAYVRTITLLDGD